MSALAEPIPTPEGSYGGLHLTVPLPPDLITEWMLVTPELAREFLALNTRNRGLSEPKVSYIMGVIQRREWIPEAADPIIIDVNGHLVNAQHRLYGVVRSGVPEWFLVIRGARPGVMEVIDQAYARNFTQFLTMDGFNNRPEVLSKALNHLYRILNGLEVAVPGSRKPSIQQLKEVRAAHSGIVQSIDVGHETYLGNQKVISEHILIAYHYVMSQVDPDLAQEFFLELATGNDISEGMPTYALRLKYAKYLARKPSRKDNAILAAWLVQAWEKARRGQNITDRSLNWNGGRKAQSFPRVSDLPWGDLDADDDEGSFDLS
jgi:hypothetical protein